MTANSMDQNQLTLSQLSHGNCQYPVIHSQPKYLDEEAILVLTPLK